MCVPCNAERRKTGPAKGHDYCACGQLKDRNAARCKACHTSGRKANSTRQDRHPSGTCFGCDKKIIFGTHCYECATGKQRTLAAIAQNEVAIGA